jgi:hypothetical protein
VSATRFATAQSSTGARSGDFRFRP